MGRGTRLVSTIATIVFVITMPVLLLTTNLRWLISDLALYEKGFANYSVPEVTGLKMEELRQAARDIITYFNGTGPFATSVKRPDGSLLFNQKETQHLEDVRDLAKLGMRAQEASLLVFLLLTIWALWKGGWAKWAALAGTGSALTLPIFGLLGGLALLTFDQAFLLFHLVSFQNDLWMLDPRTDYMIRMFPQPFWQDAAFRWAAMTLVEALAIGLGAGAILLATMRRRALAMASQQSTAKKPGSSKSLFD